MCEPNKHKFRTNWDSLTAPSRTEGIPTMYSKETLSLYSLVIFCERCGAIVHNGNEPLEHRIQRQQRLGLPVPDFYPPKVGTKALV